MKKRDVFLVLALLAVAAALYFAFGRPSAQIAAHSGPYVAVYVGNEAEPREKLYLGEERDVPVDQGNGKVNVVHVGKTGAYMKSSTCENQDCVYQGEVTLENVETRALFNWIVCLPNGVALELITEEEAP